jgi:membrane-associated phospholipid phosphatase
LLSERPTTHPRSSACARIGAGALSLAILLVAAGAQADPPSDAPADDKTDRPTPKPALAPEPDTYPSSPSLPLQPRATSDKVMTPPDDLGHDDTSWKPRREYRFGTADYVITGAAIGGIIVGAVVSPSGNRWRGGILIDEDARDALRFESLRGRYWVRDASDVGISLASTWPFLVDALVTAWWYRGRVDVARNMALVSAQAFALASATQSLGNLLGSRERPFGRLCGTEIPEKSVDCEPDVRYRSFFSGHATLAFTGAGLVCANHLGLGLLGTTGDILSCAFGYGAATMTSLFRVMSDMHYVSDAVIGAVVGTAAGIAVPLLHFKPPTEPAAGKVDVRLGPVGQGIGLVGSF